MLWALQIAEIGLRGSKHPRTVVPEVAITQKGVLPASLAAYTPSSRESILIMPSSSVATLTQLS